MSTSVLVVERLTFTAPLIQVQAAKGLGYEALLIKPGVYVPGIGNPGGKRIRIGASVLQKMTPAWDGTPLSLQHGGPKAGVLLQPRYDGGVRVFVGLVEGSPAYADAVAFVNSRFERKEVPNISMEVGNPRFQKAAIDDKDADVELVDGTPEGAALVDVGACDDRAGCGLGLAAAITTGGVKPAFQVPAGNGDDNHGDNDMGNPPPNAGDAEAGALVALQASHTTLTAERDSLAAQVASYEKAERESLTLALAASAPVGVKVEDVLGKEPSIPEMRLALRAWAVAKPAPAPAAGGRITSAPNKSGSNAPTSADRLLALRAQHGLKESKLPRAMQGNTDRILAGLEAPEQA